MSDISRLFDEDPLQQTTEDFNELVAELRERRHQFNLGNMKAGSSKPKTEKQKETEELSGKVNLDINDLL